MTSESTSDTITPEVIEVAKKFDTGPVELQTLLSNKRVQDAAMLVVGATKSKDMAGAFFTKIPWYFAGRFTVCGRDKTSDKELENHGVYTQNATRVVRNCVREVRNTARAGTNGGEVWKKNCAVVWYHETYESESSSDEGLKNSLELMASCCKSDTNFEKGLQPEA